jgi:hypothetical protein
MPTILLAELWASLGPLAFVVRPNECVLMAALLPQSALIPITDSVVNATG